MTARTGNDDAVERGRVPLRRVGCRLWSSAAFKAAAPQGDDEGTPTKQPKGRVGVVERIFLAMEHL